MPRVWAFARFVMPFSRFSAASLRIALLRELRLQLREPKLELSELVDAAYRPRDSGHRGRLACGHRPGFDIGERPVEHVERLAKIDRNLLRGARGVRAVPPALAYPLPILLGKLRIVLPTVEPTGSPL